MATISTTEYLDSGTARTAGESMSIAAGGKLIVRTDTRWHVGAPASMTGSLGLMSMSDNADGFYIDGTKVRWIAYTSGSGTVPAIGTTLTQGAVSGYVLAFYANLTSAPTAVGASVPVTGFIKFREVTGGTYSAGAVTASSASVTLSGPDVTGWIEIAQEANFTSRFSSNGMVVEGDWFYLDNTNGSNGQVLQIPTNGGGAGTNFTGVEIETAPGSNIYEWYPALVANGTAGGWITTALTTDIRAKFVQNITNGQVRIGSDGTNNIGYVPPSGCKVRVPNIFIRQTSSGARATNSSLNTTIASRSVFGTGGGPLIIKNAMVSTYVNFSAVAKAINFENSLFEGRISLSQIKNYLYVKNVAIGHSVVANGQGFFMTSVICPDLTDIDKLYSTVITDGILAFDCNNTSYLKAKNLVLYKVTNRASAQDIISFNSRSTNIEIDVMRTCGGRVFITNTNGIKILNIDYTDRSGGATTSTGGQGAIFTSTGAENVLIDGITFGLNGQLTAVHPYGHFLNSVTSKNVVIQNAGTRASPLSVGSTPSLYPQTLWTGYGDENISLKRIYLGNSRNAALSWTTIGFNTNFENVYCGNTTAISHTGAVVTSKGMYGVFTTSGVEKYSAPWVDSFTSDTVGKITLYFCPPDGEDSYIFPTLVGQSAFTNAGNISFLNGTGSEVIYEMNYYAKGHTSFANTAINYTSSASNLAPLFYQIDKGAGWNGTWTALTLANLLAETGIDPAIGIKLKVKLTCTTNAQISSTSVVLTTNSSAAAQTDNLYPLSVSTLGFTNLVPGSEVRVYQGTDPATSVEIGGTESVGGTTFSFTHSSGGQDGTIAIFAMGYQPIYLPYTFKTTDDSILIQQVVDRNYVNPV